MKKGDYIFTPRFCTVRIEKVFKTLKTAYAQGYHEPTHYDNPKYDIKGKHTGTNRIVFAAIRKS